MGVENQEGHGREVPLLSNSWYLGARLPSPATAATSSADDYSRDKSQPSMMQQQQPAHGTACAQRTVPSRTCQDVRDIQGRKDGRRRCAAVALHKRRPTRTGIASDAEEMAVLCDAVCSVSQPRPPQVTTAAAKQRITDPQSCLFRAVRCARTECRREENKRPPVDPVSPRDRLEGEIIVTIIILQQISR